MNKRSDSKRYDVYGIGNALVDKEFEVEDVFLAEHGINKGMMSLIQDRAEHERMLHTLEQRFPLKSQSGGGSAANTLYALSQFGGKAFLSCRVADDANGEFYLQQLGSHNIQTNLNRQGTAGATGESSYKRAGKNKDSGGIVSNDDDGSSRSDGGDGSNSSNNAADITGRCLVMISPDAERTMLTYLGISADISERELDLEAARDSQYIYLEGYLVSSADARRAVIRLKEFAAANGVRTALTFSDPAMVEYFSDEINTVLGDGVDLLFCNEREAKIWSGAATLDDACAALRAKARRFAITRGGDGALLFDGELFIDIPPQPVKAIDTNGAGDMFAGAFLYALSQGHDFPTAGNLASLASATTVSHFGPRLPPKTHHQILTKFQT